jgi:hypothetical protein
MKSDRRLAAVACACVILLAGCTASHAGAADGSKAHTTAGATAQATTTAGPSAAVKMVCATETRTNIAKALGLKTAPKPSATWADSTYTCVYALPMGRLVLSVKHSPTPQAARAYLDSTAQRLGATTSLSGPAKTALASSDGTVLLLKDSDVLQVNATLLPAVVGTQHLKRNDFAALMASDILACWTGDGS